ncbi:GGDEF domain-containing protein [Pseudoduganella danionis]|uniref:diguanylate cyclase n=2 Tax=Pseudoduganella danionis TaxID=1890295 RepID=A0ABW9SVQ4_9BURK|nr:diguanylate cyclase [Pseudoduganella danionis]MTW35233.1 diguanylate cyclase [Pseudoduganella danionis]
MSLRTKLMLALLLTGLASVAMVGGLASYGLGKKVDIIRRQSAAEHFYSAVSDYLRPYGSWQAANQTEPFDHYMQRIRPAPEHRLPPPDEGIAGREYLPAAPPGFEHARRGAPPDALRDRRGPPPPRSDGDTPYHFILADQDFSVLLGAGVYRPGEPLPEAARRDARAVEVNGKVAAYISPEGVLTPSREEQQYLDAMYDALWAGVSGAALLALALGVLLSRGLSRQLRHLIAAVRAIQQGTLRQNVPVEGRDEVAMLARAFNEMSAELAQSHEALQASHRTISSQAEQLRELSVRDALTGLHNRRYFDEQAASLYRHAVRYQRPFSMVIADIDFFKRINDQLTHATGDAVLRAVGEIFRTHMRESDLVARYGGEEFVMAFPETSLAQAAVLCDKLRELIVEHPWQQVHSQLAVTISIGVAADLQAGSAEAMLQQADAQLYRAKQDGRNRVCSLAA